MVKKILFLLFVFLLITFLAFWAWLTYQRTKVFTSSIPQDTRTLVLINSDFIARSILEEGNTNIKPVKESGLEIPLKMLVVGMPSPLEPIFSIKLKISDQQAFRRFLDQEFVKNNNVYQHKNWPLSCLFDKQSVVFASAKIPDEATVQQMMAWLKNQSVVSFKTSRFWHLSKQKHHVVWQHAGFSGFIDFQKGRVAGVFETSKQIARSPNLTLPADVDAGCVISGDAGWLMDRLFQDKAKRNGPTNAVAVFLKGETIQETQALSYEYDDNFEKKAVQKLAKESVPGVWIAAEYIDSNNKVADTLVGGILVEKTVEKNYTVWTNLQKNNQVVPAYLTSPFNLWVDFAKIAQHGYALPFRKYLLPLRSLEMEASKESPQKDEVKFALNFRDTNKSSFVQILENF